MKETLCHFGSVSGLVGVLTEPTEAQAGEAPVVVLLSAGLLHRIGPFRLYTTLARQLAAQGVSSLRFDLSGIGDSDSSELAASINERTLADVRAAYDFLEQQHGVKSFVVGGLCSGADDAFRASLDDERVVGSFQLDGMGYRTKRFYVGLMLRHYLPRLLSPSKWLQVLRRQRAAEHHDQVSSRGGDEDLDRSMPSLEEAKQGLAAMEEKGHKSLLVYTGGISEYYNYAGQIYDSIPEAKHYRGLSEVYLPKSDHTYMLKSDRQELISLLCDWFTTSWPRPTQ